MCLCIFQFQLNPGVLPFFPSQFLPKDTQRDMLEPISDKYSAADEGLTDWNPFDYNALWTQGPQSPFSQVYDTEADVRLHSSPAPTWTGMPVADAQHRTALDKNQHYQQTTATLPEQASN